MNYFDPLNPDPVTKEHDRLYKERLEAEERLAADPNNQVLRQDAIEKHKIWQKYLFEHLDVLMAQPLDN